MNIKEAEKKLGKCPWCDGSFEVLEKHGTFAAVNQCDCGMYIDTPWMETLEEVVELINGRLGGTSNQAVLYVAHLNATIHKQDNRIIALEGLNRQLGAERDEWKEEYLKLKKERS